METMKSGIVTGGVACGKSRVTELLAGLFGPKVAVFSADEAVGRLLEDHQVQAALVTALGPSVMSGGSVDRQWLANQVLPVSALRRRLEEILHPPVLVALEAARDEARKAGMNLFLAEVPLHYEIGAAVSADFVIVVASSRSVQVRRMMEVRRLDEPTVHKFLDAQWPVEAKVERADIVIWNDGSPASLEAQVLTLASPLLHA